MKTKQSTYPVALDSLKIGDWFVFDEFSSDFLITIYEYVGPSYDYITCYYRTVTVSFGYNVVPISEFTKHVKSSVIYPTINTHKVYPICKLKGGVKNEK